MKKDLESSGNHYNLQLVNENKNSNSEPQSNSNNPSFMDNAVIKYLSRNKLLLIRSLMELSKKLRNHGMKNYSA